MQNAVIKFQHKNLQAIEGFSCALAMYQFIEQVQLALQGFEGAHFTALQRIRTLADLDIFIDTIVYYSITITDCALATSMTASFSSIAFADAEPYLLMSKKFSQFGACTHAAAEYITRYRCAFCD